MDLDDLDAIAEKERAARKPVRIRCCTAAGCMSSGSARVIGGAERRHSPVRTGRPRRDRRGRLHAALLRGPAGPGRSGRLALPAVSGPRTPGRSSSALDGGRRHPRIAATRANPSSPARWPIVLENSGQIEPERIERYIEAGGYRALHHALREMTPAQVVEEVSKQRPARSRRRGISDRPEVGHDRQATGDAQVRRLQRRRGRPRGLHGSQRARERPAPGPRRDGDRGLRGRGQPGVHLRPRRVSAGHPPAGYGDQAGQEVRAARAARSSNRRSISGSTSASVPARSSAARRPR